MASVTYSLAATDDLADIVAQWEAIAEDGSVHETVWFCEQFITRWQALGLAELFPQVVSAFEAVRTKCKV